MIPPFSFRTPHVHLRHICTLLCRTLAYRTLLGRTLTYRTLLCRTLTYRTRTYYTASCVCGGAAGRDVRGLQARARCFARAGLTSRDIWSHLVNATIASSELRLRLMSVYSIFSLRQCICVLNNNHDYYLEIFISDRMF